MGVVSHATSHCFKMETLSTFFALCFTLITLISTFLSCNDLTLNIIHYLPVVSYVNIYCAVILVHLI